jgi:MoaA/NifB/PqqE/SkfB family radical SAM enzyme
LSHPRVQLQSLETLWFQVGGTVCNLACKHCLVSCSPSNHTHEMMTLEQIEPYLEEAARLGVKEYYFTGGEPFLNPEMEAILRATLRNGPVTVLTNGLRLYRDRARRLRRLAENSEYSLDLRISLDGYDAASNDAIRGVGTFRRVLRRVQDLVEEGLNPVLTVTEVCNEVGSAEGRGRFFDLLAELGIDKPRLKVLPLFRIGAEASRSGAYESWQSLTCGEAQAGDWNHLQCSSCRMVTDQGVWVCPILVNEPYARMGERIADTLVDFQLEYQACWTCHVQGASCRT